MPIKTLVVDDTILYRKITSDVLRQFKEIEVVGTASNGDLALRKMKTLPVNLVFCDVYMPKMNGVETLAEIKETYPQTIVVMMSSITTRSADITIKALEMGAIDFIRKPDGKSIEENIERLKNDIQAVLRLVQIRLTTQGIIKKSPGITLAKPVSPPVKPVVSREQVPRKFSVLAIGVSTGGPEALNRLIPALPKSLPVPVLLVQHMPPKFTHSLAESLDRKSKIKVVEARDGQIIEPGMVYIAPGGFHMIAKEEEKKTIIKTNTGPPENSCRPAIDVLFRSVTNIYGGKGILAVILTGMGSDGANGVRSMKRKGCYCITQSEASCVVYGMPRAVDLAGLSNISLPLTDIAGEICKKLKC